MINLYIWLIAVTIASATTTAVSLVDLILDLRDRKRDK